jgi:hypothetical protein
MKIEKGLRQASSRSASAVIDLENLLDGTVSFKRSDQVFRPIDCTAYKPITKLEVGKITKDCADSRDADT